MYLLMHTIDDVIKMTGPYNLLSEITTSIKLPLISIMGQLLRYT